MSLASASWGLRAGMHVVVHSAMRHFNRRLEHGPDTVIDALEEVITPGGIVVMPTFSGRVIYFLEALAARNEQLGRERFEGSVAELWSEMKEHAESEGGFRPFPYERPMDLWQRMTVEGAVGRWPGWDVGPADVEANEDTVVHVKKLGPALPPEDLKPNRMPITTGKIPARFADRPETRRSEQYSGSFAAWGALTDRVLERHDNHSDKVFEDHPLHRMMELGGKILLIGIDHGRNSTVHVAEGAAIRARGVDIPNEFLGPFMTIDEPLTRAGGQVVGRIAEADVRLVDTAVMYRIVAGILDEKLASGEVVPKAE